MIWIKISLKRQLKRICKILSDTFTILGVFITVGEAVNEIFNYQGLFLIYQSHIIFVVVIALIVSAIKNWDTLTFKTRINGSPDVAITLKVCNALENEGALIVPTNSTFDTIMTDDFISEKSLQGQYQIKYYRNRLLELDQLIEQGLADKQYVKINDGRKTKTKRYPIGTVSKISGDNVKKRAYFLVDSDININGIPENCDVSNLSQSLVCLWDCLSIIGNMETYSVPLIGTGHGRVKNASRDEVVKEIVISFLAASREQKITENLIICIHPADYEKIHWDELCEFVRYQCTFAEIISNNRLAIGKQEETSDKATLKSDEMEASFHFFGLDDNKEELEFKPLGCNKSLEKKIISILTGNQLNIAEFAEAMGLSMKSASDIVKSLLEKGYVQIAGLENNSQYTATALGISNNVSYDS